MYFFIKDKIKAGEVSLKYCPADKMWAHILTKPMQGKAFREMRVKLMKCAVDYLDNMMVAMTDSINQKPTEDVPEMVSFKQNGSSPQECWKKSEIRKMEREWG